MYEQEILETFKKGFEPLKDKKKIIYGLGPKTKVILETFPEYEIIGLMDRDQMSGDKYGLPVLSYEQVETLNPDMIIIVALAKNMRTIYNRILDFCQKNKIDIYYMDGSGPLQDKVNQENKADSYWNLDATMLKSRIDANDVISFDIFDTLIMRKTLAPKDVFRIWEDKASKKEGIYIQGLAELRIKAEEVLIGDSPTIDSIYRQLQKMTGLDDNDRDRLKNLEIKIEKSILIPRKKMVEIFNYACESKKKVYLVSDMYLGRHILEGILEKCGIAGYQGLYVSCDYQKSKCDGLFESYKEAVPASTYLHIGDNPVADGQFARDNGMESFLIRSALESLEKSELASLLSLVRTSNDRGMLGLFMSQMFNDPFCFSCENHKLKIRTNEEIGFLFFGSLLTNFVLWMAQIAKKENYDALLLGARDGFLIDKLYAYICENCQEYSNNPKGIYMLTSRAASLRAGIISEDDIIKFSKQPYNGSPQEMLRDKFGLKQEQIKAYDPSMTIDDYALKHSSYIFQNQKEHKKQYREYLKEMGILEGSYYGFFDFVTSGTCLKFLSEVMEKRLQGLFLGVYGDIEEKKLDYHAQFKIPKTKDYEVQSQLLLYYQFMETFMTSDQASFLGIDEVGKPIYAKETRDERYMDYIFAVQGGIETFAKSFIDDLWIGTEEISTSFSENFISLIEHPRIQIKKSLLDGITLFEDLGVGVIETRFSNLYEEDDS